MSKGITGNLHAHFEGLEDKPRVAGKRHKLIDILTIAICGILCGADDWSGIEADGQAKAEWLKGFFELPPGIPSHDTFGRVFSWLDPDAFESSFLRLSEHHRGHRPGSWIIKRGYLWTSG